MLIAVGKLLPGPQPGHVRHSRVSPFYMSSNPARDITAVAVGNGFKAYARWPEYFARYGRREPPSVTHTPFSFAWGHPELPPWEVKALFPEYAASFARSMKSRQIVGGDMKLVGPEALYDMSWLGEEARRRASGGDDDSAVVAVDVGGGLGQLLRDIVTSVPGVAAGQCVLQDRKEVIEEAAAAAAAGGVIQEVRMMEHDFHIEQPVKGTYIHSLPTLTCLILRRPLPQKHPHHLLFPSPKRKENNTNQPTPPSPLFFQTNKKNQIKPKANHPSPETTGAAIYLLRRILLDYPDSLAINILRHLAEALPPTESNPRARILIMEERLLDDGPPVPQNRIVDLVMLSIGGKLRDEKIMTSLATAAGLRVVGFHARPGEPACVVECARA